MKRITLGADDLEGEELEFFLNNPTRSASPASEPEAGGEAEPLTGKALQDALLAWFSPDESGA